MCREAYYDFVSGFSLLNPYELDHLSDALLVKFEEALSDRGRSNERLQFCLQDIKHVVTRAMRDILLEMAEDGMTEAKIKLERAKADTFKPRKVTESDVHQLTDRSGKSASRDK